MSAYSFVLSLPHRNAKQLGIMKKTLLLSVTAAVLLCGCNTYTGAGAYAGATLGGVFGSIVGGINGGPRGSDVGALVGMAGGAIAGAAIGSVADQQEAEKAAAAGSRATTYQTYHVDADDVDDRIDFGSATDQTPPNDVYSSATLTVRNVRFVDENGDGRLNPGETGRIMFEVINDTPVDVYDVVPMVTEANGNRNILISESARIEGIAPGKGIRYTAMVKGDKRLRSGRARFLITAITPDGKVNAPTKTLLVTTFR